jgi:hypothetical protein
VLARDYYEGPISIHEHDQAIRQAETSKQMTIVPVLLEGKESDYCDKFIGGYTMKHLPMDTEDEYYIAQFEALASFLSTPLYSSEK